MPDLSEGGEKGRALKMEVTGRDLGVDFDCHHWHQEEEEDDHGDDNGYNDDRQNLVFYT